MGCESVARGILIIFNILFFLLGAAALGVGIWVIIDAQVFLEVLGELPAETNTYGRLIADAGYILIAAGGAVFLISFLGCCGAWKKIKGLLVTYVIILVLILLAEIACIVVGYFFYDNVVGTVQTSLAGFLSTQYDSQFIAETPVGTYTYKPGNLISKGVDAIQMEFSCCGVNNYTDYMPININETFPATCCKPSGSVTLKTLVDQLWEGTATKLELFDSACFNNGTYIAETKGCFQAITDEVRSKSTLFIAIAGATAGVQLLLILFACCLFCAIRNEEKRP